MSGIPLNQKQTSTCDRNAPNIIAFVRQDRKSNRESGFLSLSTKKITNLGEDLAPQGIYNGCGKILLKARRGAFQKWW